MEQRVILIGPDLPFWHILSSTAHTLEIPCQNLQNLPIKAEMTDFEQGILFFSLHDDISNDLIIRLNQNSPPIKKFIVHVSDENFYNSLNDKMLDMNCYDDVINRTIDSKLLAKKLSLYRDCLRSRKNSPDDMPYHQLLKKNFHLNNQITGLQQSLQLVDSSRRIQEQVIDKINQISQLSRQINCLDIHRIATVCIEKIPRLIAARFASLYSLDCPSETLKLLHHNHPYTIERHIVLSERPDSPMAVAVRLKKLLLIDDLGRWTEAQKQNLNRPFNRNYQSNSCIVAPLLSGGDIMGVLNLADKIDGPAFDAAADLAPVQLLREIIGSAMSNIKLYEAVQKQAQTDGLTGLLNHRAFYTCLARETQRASRYGSSLSLLMIDMDNLKQINDYFGHQTGDAALLHIAGAISQCIRETDQACRYGGDEFAVILPNTSLSDALIVANRLVHNIDCSHIAAGDQPVAVTISVGLSPYQSGQSVEQFARHADNALLEAKKTGKNRIHIAEPVSS
jgi:diguanylate cyclase (GGDEF)-like protein